MKFKITSLNNNKHLSVNITKNLNNYIDAKKCLKLCLKLLLESKNSQQKTRRQFNNKQVIIQREPVSPVERRHLRRGGGFGGDDVMTAEVGL